ncbi:hypothetical protein KAR91_80805 [Candidatus Pacearchaeota archaeon]|nr:hypothetical protein [Candidatus Pacearchaeota archaeon]
MPHLIPGENKIEVNGYKLRVRLDGEIVILYIPREFLVREGSRAGAFETLMVLKRELLTAACLDRNRMLHFEIDRIVECTIVKGTYNGGTRPESKPDNRTAGNNDGEHQPEE